MQLGVGLPDEVDVILLLYWVVLSVTLSSRKGLFFFYKYLLYSVFQELGYRGMTRLPFHFQRRSILFLFLFTFIEMTVQISLLLRSSGSPILGRRTFCDHVPELVNWKSGPWYVWTVDGLLDEFSSFLSSRQYSRSSFRFLGSEDFTVSFIQVLRLGALIQS